MLDDNGNRYEMQFPVVTGYTSKTVCGKMISVVDWTIIGSAFNGNSSVTVNGSSADPRWAVLRSVMAVWRA